MLKIFSAKNSLEARRFSSSTLNSSGHPSAVRPRLSALTLTGQGGQLRLELGTALILPTDEWIWPDPEALAWHSAHVFRR
ncbi:hypothetical protein FNU79_17150 [Deinococcus detaillensis]|uniref:Uncharacterized protein n=1 Tax=Deinococcus detaillensis TaxID=2592048 RepID=A0A553UIH8_9DEIO|nr:hypothetical protein FNU79_17150 [Deinococcus detaillensis]